MSLKKNHVYDMLKELYADDVIFKEELIATDRLKDIKVELMKGIIRDASDSEFNLGTYLELL